MSDQPINLNKARKAKAKARKEQQAETARLEKLRKEIDAAKRET